METTETISKYEIPIILDAKLTQEQKDNTIKEVSEIIKKHGGKVINTQVWIEKQRFTFPIKKQSEGTYYLVNIEGDGSGNAKIRSEFRLNEEILRFAIIQSE